jgi:hypothetical protein
MTGNEANIYLQENCRQGSGGKTVFVDSADRRGKDFLGTMQTVGEQPIMGGVEKMKWKNTPLSAQCRHGRGTSVLWEWCRRERWKELFLGIIWAGMWENIFFCGQGTHEKEKWASQEEWRQEDSSF